MSGPLAGVGEARVSLVYDDVYFDAALELIRGAVHFCRCVIFIVDLSPHEPEADRVDALLRELGAATWRGVDARLLVGGSRSNRSILDAALAARRRAQGLGVDARLGAARPGRSEHSKFVVADGAVLLGSHNWSPGAMSGQVQDSVIVEHEGVAAHLIDRFDLQWPLAEGLGFDVQG